MLDCTILTTDAQAQALEKEWRELQQRSGTSIFTDYDWFLIWRQTLGMALPRTLHIVTGREGGRLVALLPLAIFYKKGFRILQGIGAEAFYCCDLLCEQPAYAQELWRVARESPHYDFAHIRDACPGSVCEQALASFATRREESVSTALNLKVFDTVKAWRASLSASLRQSLGRNERNMAKHGPVQYTVYEQEPPAHIIEDLIRHKKIWCEARVMKGMFDQPNVLGYYQQLVRVMAANKRLALGLLTCADAVVAYNLMFLYGGRLYFYVIADDAAWRAYSPGILAINHAIAWAIEHKMECFDFMQGDNDYKRRFANEVHACNEYTFHRSFRGAVGEAMYVYRRYLKTYIFKKAPNFIRRML